MNPIPLPYIICACSPSSAIEVQTAGPSRCHGIDTSSTVAPSARSRPAASRTFWSTSGSLSGRPKPSVTTPIRMPTMPRPSAVVYLSTRTLYWRGSSPSAPATTSSSSALSATVAVIGPAWSIVASIGITPVYGTSPWVAFIP